MSGLTLVLLIVVPLMLTGFTLYAVLRYVPIVERNAFDVPRYPVAVDYASPPSTLKSRMLQIPYDTRSAIDAHYIKAQHGKKKLVVFCHETGADLNSWYKHARFLPDDGIDVLTFNFKPTPLAPHTAKDEDRHFQWPSLHDLRCLERVLSWVAVEKKGYEIALFGISKGATVAAAAAPSPLIKCVLLDGAFSTHLTLQRYMRKFVNIYVSPRKLAECLPNWVYLLLSYTTLVYAGLRNNLRFFSIEKFAAKLRKPVFLIHAGKDYHVPLEHIEQVRQLIPGMTDLWVAEKASHSQAVTLYPKEYHSRIVSFLNKTLV